MQQTLEERLAPTLEALGYELIEVEHSPRGTLRVFIDRSAGITLDDCTAVSNHLSRWLVVEGVAYERLEVSSPGMDRRLKRARDFARFAGERCELRLKLPLGNRRNFVGVLKGATEQSVSVDVEGKNYTFALADIERARLKPAF